MDFFSELQRQAKAGASAGDALSPPAAPPLWDGTTKSTKKKRRSSEVARTPDPGAAGRPGSPRTAAKARRLSTGDAAPPKKARKSDADGASPDPPARGDSRKSLQQAARRSSYGGTGVIPPSEPPPAAVSIRAHPFETEYGDHFETSSEALEDLARGPLAAAVAPAAPFQLPRPLFLTPCTPTAIAWRPLFLFLRCESPESPSRRIPGQAPVLRWLATRRAMKPVEMRVYDPYFCQGAVVGLLGRLGFPRVINRNRDFYADAATRNLPQYDVLVTNPPYRRARGAPLSLQCIPAPLIYPPPARWDGREEPPSTTILPPSPPHRSGKHKDKILEFCLGCGKPWALLVRAPDHRARPAGARAAANPRF